MLCITQLQKLKEHKYNAHGSSIMEKFLQPFWKYVVELMPLWVAPNLITITGLAVNVATSLLVMYFCPRASDLINPILLVLCCIGLLVYQTLDAIDGKQARRTGSSSPLGELFDHGCDAVSIIFVSIAVACTINLGHHPDYMFFFFFHNAFLFYLAHWQTYVTGILLFGRIDVTEAQLLGCAVFLSTAIYGGDLWRYEVNFLWNLTIAQLCVLFTAIGGVYYDIRALSRIFAGGVGKNKSSVSGTSVLSPAIPIGIVLACAFYVYKHSHSNIFQEEPCLTTLMYGTAIAKLTCKLVIATMTKHPLDMVDSCMLGPAVLSCINYFSVPLDERSVLHGALVFELFNLFIFCTKVCLEISTYLGIHVFHITQKSIPQKKSE